MKKVRRGFTLAEMIMAIILMSMIAVIIGVIFNTMFSSRELVEREASIQAEMRTSMQYVDRVIGKATSVFILDDSKYNDNVAKTAGWSYIGLSPDGTKVVNYVWNKSKNDWDISKLGTKSLYNMKLDLEFKTDGIYQDNRLISYNLTGKYPDTNNKLSIDTAISALNSKQVFSKVAKGKKGIALAYRNDPIEGQMNVAISFVFDKSGSMKKTLDGKETDDKARTRMGILRTKAQEMVKELESVGNVSVNLVAFSNYGTYIQQKFSDLDRGTTEIDASIGDLESDGGVTNPGDGLRYGMISLRNNPAQLKYVVLLTDGVPNAYIVDPKADYDGNKYWDSGLEDFIKVEYDLSTNLVDSPRERLAYDVNDDNSVVRGKSINYARDVSKKFGFGIKRVNVIGFSGLDEEKAFGEELTTKIGEGGMETKYVSATNADDLKKTFSDIKKQIQQDLWFVSGP